ncbi:MAG: inlA 2 [Planctomycetaceae bacterium]|nr:inlA 2 [Planctomycetaceae bacterium]
MQLASDIAVNMAGALGRFLVRRYLKEPVDVPGESLLAIARRKLTDVIQQREVARQFEDYADRIVQHLWRSLESRLKEQPALDLNAVAREIADTLGQTVSSDFVMRKRLEPAPLTDAFKATRVPALPELERQAYELTLDESLRYLVETAAALPRFELPQAPECLKRLRTSGEDVDRALETVKLIEWRVFGDVKLSDATVEQRWEADYRQAIIRELDHVDLFGADIPAEAKRNLLTDAFVSLNINQKVKADTPQLLDNTAPNVEKSVEATEYLGLRSCQSVFDQLVPGTRGRLMIRGSAGMGKTTLMRWAAIQAAKSVQSNTYFKQLIRLIGSWGKSLIGSSLPGAAAPRVENELVSWASDTTDEMNSDVPVETKRNIVITAEHSRFTSDDSIGTDRGQHFFPKASEFIATIPWKGWRFQVPFVIPLRYCQSGRLPVPDDFPTVIAEIGLAAGHARADWVKQVLLEGRALVLIDGVDEVPNQNRDEIRNELTELIQAYPQNLFVVTTRPEAVRDGWLADLQFQEARIAPLAESDVHKFIRLWHDAVEKELARRSRAAGLREEAESLIKKLRTTPDLFHLASNPLLCAMICALHHDRGQKLPEGQSELCESLCHMLLHRREREGGLNWDEFPAPYRELSYGQKKRLAQQLALVMVRQELSALPYEVALKHIEQTLRELGRTPADASVVLTGLVERSGMLREPNPGSIDFLHNTFKEYLAGEALAQDENDELGQRILAQSEDAQTQASWRRIALFAAARQDRAADRVIQAVLSLVDGISDADSFKRRRALNTHRIVFALQCERTADEAGRSINQDLRTQLRALKVQSTLRPRTFAESDQIALLGDQAVEFLGRINQEPAARSAACVRALRLINTTTSRQIIESYYDHTELPVIIELCQIVHPLSLPNVRKLVQKTSFGNSLPDGVRERITDLNPIAADTDWLGVSKLNFNGTAVRDLGPLAGLMSLQWLYLNSTPVSDISPLAGLKSLRELYLNLTAVSDLSPLAGLTTLEWLDLNSTTVSDLSPLADLTSLQVLDLNSTEVSDLSPLAGLTSLRELYLNSTAVSDLSPLACLTSLQELDLNSTEVSDVSPLADLKYLEIGGLESIDARANANRQNEVASNKLPVVTAVLNVQLQDEVLQAHAMVHPINTTALTQFSVDTSEDLDPLRRIGANPDADGFDWWIGRVDVANFRGFERKQFEFRSSITVLIGNNATGKTSVIEALAVALGAFARGFDDAAPREFLDRDVHRQGGEQRPAPVSVRATGRCSGERVDWIRVLELQNGKLIEREEMVAWSLAQRLQRRVRDFEEVTLPVFTVFSSQRRIQFLDVESLETFAPVSRMHGYMDWQRPMEDLRSFELWLKTRVLETQQLGHPPVDLLAVQAAVRLAFQKAVFPDFAARPPVSGSLPGSPREHQCCLVSIDWNIRQNWPEAVFDKATRQRLSLLSDGQIGFLALVAEIARRSAVLNPHFGADAAAKSPGIVLIDELDLHIHPRWQRTLIDDLKRTFPRMQFVIATHSALIVQSLNAGEVINLDPNSPPNQDFRKLSAEEVLEDVMGNENTKRGIHFNDMQRVAARYYKLLEERSEDDDEVMKLKEELDRLIAPYSDEPAFHAFLERKRERAGLGG